MYFECILFALPGCGSAKYAGQVTECSHLRGTQTGEKFHYNAKNLPLLCRSNDSNGTIAFTASIGKQSRHNVLHTIFFSIIINSFRN